jgi:hypothetical protein
MNMPLAMKKVMVDPHGQVLNTTESLAVMFVSHALDTLLHPGIVYLLWRAHSCSCPKKEMVTWPVIISTFLTSRIWSAVHVYHNTREFGWWYFGHDVYHIHDLDSWLPAYLAEGLFHVMLVVYKLMKR